MFSFISGSGTLNTTILTATGNVAGATYGSNASVSDAELLVIGTTLQGELAGTLGNPTVDATHSGSAHHTILTISDTNTIDLSLTGQLLSADSLLTFYDGLTFNTASVDC